ncbi:hypothetical protein F9C07_9691, partial [Aspergillus flavus]
KERAKSASLSLLRRETVSAEPSYESAERIEEGQGRWESFPPRSPGKTNAVMPRQISSSMFGSRPPQYPEAKGIVWKVSRDDGAGECPKTSVLGRQFDLNGSGGGTRRMPRTRLFAKSRQSFPWPLAGLPTCSRIPRLSTLTTSGRGCISSAGIPGSNHLVRVSRGKRGGSTQMK